MASVATADRRAGIIVTISFTATIRDDSGATLASVQVELTAEVLAVNIQTVVDIDVVLTVPIGGVPTAFSLRISVVVVATSAPTTAPTIAPTAPASDDGTNIGELRTASCS